MEASELLTPEQLQQLAIQDGRCPNCGRPSDATEAKAFQDLRDTLAETRDERDQQRRQIGELEEERNLLAARLRDLEEQ